jgi:hypothetical protein
MSNPADLNTVPQPDTDKNYFNFKATGLKIDQTYAIKFQWVYSDGTVSDWSPGKFVNTSTESVPSAPTATVTGGAGFIKVELPTFPTNALRVDIRIAGGTFGTGTVVADSFTSAGVKTIAALGAADPGNAYVVTLLTVTPSKINGDPTSATTVYVTDPSAALVVTAPQDPFAPVVKAGLASVIVEWSGKKSDGTDLTVTGFSGARVHIGTSSGFTPSADNWVHTLNFANGSNRVSIGVGSVIDKTAGTTLQYGTAYHVKLVAVNASGTTSGAVSASNNPVTVARLPASEIDAGILRADAYIQAGADGGQRAVLSGSTSPFIIYGTDGTTKLLEFLTSGTTGTLAIKGSGTFSGDISAASGTFTGNVTTSGNISASNGLFSVNNGLLTAQSGTIGGWTITGSLLESAVVGNNKITLNPSTPKIALVQGSTEKITIDPVEGIKDSVGNFTLTPAGILTVKGAITSGSTITGADITMTGSVSGYGVSSTKLLFQASNYAISAGSSSYTYVGTSGSYDDDGDWIDSISNQTVTNTDIRFTDASLAGAVPSSGSNFSYGELWLGGGAGSSASVDLWANYPGGFIGISLAASASSKNIYVYGDSSAGFTTQHRSSTSDSSKESPAFLQVDSSGRMSRGRAIITGGSSSPSNTLGLKGDLYFSTAT